MRAVGQSYPPLGLDRFHMMWNIPCMGHAYFIEQLGGSATVARVAGVSFKVADNWRRRGIAYPYRPRIARHAQEANVPLPDGFLDPPGDIKRSN
jgi:hypothetical protein